VDTRRVLTVLGKCCVLNTNEGISIKFYPKNARVVHMFEFPSAETENTDGMAKLQIFVTSLWSIATFFSLWSLYCNFGETSWG
jgi:hypothetical protein